MELELRMKDELVRLKEECYVDGELKEEGIKIYKSGVRAYHERGYNTRFFESIGEELQRKLNGVNVNKIKEVLQ